PRARVRIPEAESRPRPRPAGILPLRLSRQAVARTLQLRLLQRVQLVAEQTRFLPGNLLHRQIIGTLEVAWIHVGDRTVLTLRHRGYSQVKRLRDPHPVLMNITRGTDDTPTQATSRHRRRTDRGGANIDKTWSVFRFFCPERRHLR